MKQNFKKIIILFSFYMKINADDYLVKKKDSLDGYFFQWNQCKRLISFSFLFPYIFCIFLLFLRFLAFIGFVNVVVVVFLSIV